MTETALTKAQVDELIVLITFDNGYDEHQKRRIISCIKSDWKMRAWGPVERELGDRLLMETRAFEVERMSKREIAVQIDWETARKLVGL